MTRLSESTASFSSIERAIKEENYLKMNSANDSTTCVLGQILRCGRRVEHGTLSALLISLSFVAIPRFRKQAGKDQKSKESSAIAKDVQQKDGKEKKEEKEKIENKFDSKRSLHLQDFRP